MRLNGVEKKTLPGRPLISVITVVFNNKETLEQAILSVLNQTYKNIEYIIVDGGSFDGTLDIIKKYNGRVDYWVSEPDKGIYNAMNKGIALAKGDWLHILNSDDYYFSDDVLEKAADVLISPEQNFYYFTLMFQDTNGDLKPQKFRFSRNIFWKLFYSAYLPHPAMIVHKSHYEKFGVFDERFKVAADHDLILRFCKGLEPIFCDISLTVMRAGGFSEKDWLKMAKDFKEVTIKNGLNRALANLIFYFKVLKHKIKRN